METSNNYLGFAVLLSLLILIGAPRRAEADDGTQAKSFVTRASRLLPIEKRYDYHRTLKTGSIHRPLRDPAAKPTPKEMAVPDRGWKILTIRDAGDVIDYAAGDLMEYLATSMQVAAGVSRQDSLKDWHARTGVIIAGTREQLPGLGTALKGSKGLRGSCYSGPHCRLRL